MTEDRIKESLAAAIEETTPDILSDLLAELDITDEPKELMHDILLRDAEPGEEWQVARPARRAGLRRAVMSFAAALIVFAGGFALWNSSREAFAVVGLDVNPSIEMSIDKHEKVISASSINDEGSEILADMDLKGSDVNVACNAIVGSMLTHGYLTDLSNSILVSVRTGDEEAGKAIEAKLSDNLNSYLENSEIAAAILGQVVAEDDELQSFAEANSISPGKALLIRNLMETGSAKMKQEDLLKLSTQELILLGQKRNVASEVSYGDAESKKYIGGDKAIDIAVKKAGADRTKVQGLEYEFDCEDGVVIYEVEFRYNGNEYEYDINAYDGSIVNNKTETVSSKSSGTKNAAVYDDDDDDDERYDDDREDDDRYDDDRYDDDRYDDDRDDDDRYDDDRDDDDDDRYDDDRDDDDDDRDDDDDD